MPSDSNVEIELQQVETGGYKPVCDFSQQPKR